MAFILATGIEWKDIRAAKPASAKASEAQQELASEEFDNADSTVVKKEEV